MAKGLSKNIMERVFNVFNDNKCFPIRLYYDHFHHEHKQINIIKYVCQSWLTGYFYIW